MLYFKSNFIYLAVANKNQNKNSEKITFTYALPIIKLAPSDIEWGSIKKALKTIDNSITVNITKFMSGL